MNFRLLLSIALQVCSFYFGIVLFGRNGTFCLFYYLWQSEEKEQETVNQNTQNHKHFFFLRRWGCWNSCVVRQGLKAMTWHECSVQTSRAKVKSAMNVSPLKYCYYCPTEMFLLYVIFCCMACSAPVWRQDTCSPLLVFQVIVEIDSSKKMSPSWFVMAVATWGE